MSAAKLIGRSYRIDSTLNEDEKLAVINAQFERDFKRKPTVVYFPSDKGERKIDGLTDEVIVYESEYVHRWQAIAYCPDMSDSGADYS